MKITLLGTIFFLGSLNGSIADESANNASHAVNNLSVFKELVGEWYRWEDNPKVLDSWVAPGLITDGMIWSGIALSENTILFAAKSNNDGKLWNLHVFEFSDDAVKLFSYKRDSDGIMLLEAVRTLDATSSNNSSLIWRESNGKVMRFQFSGEGKSLRMSWDKWDATMGVWDKRITAFRRDPPPSGTTEPPHP